MKTSNVNIETIFLFLFLGVIAALSFFIFLPYLAPLVVAATLAIIFRPFYKRVLKKTKERKNIASLITIFVIIALVLTPLLFFGFQIFKEARGLYYSLSYEKTSNWLNQTLGSLEKYTPSFLGSFSLTDAKLYTKEWLAKIINNLAYLFSGMLQFLVSFFLTFLALFYLLRDGDRLKESILKLSPLSQRHTKEIVEKIKNAVNSVIRGALVIALIQGILAGIGFKIFGIPNPALWGTAAMFSALLPSIGTSIILIPAVLYLFFTAKLAAALGLALWGAVAVGLIDNFLSPILIERGIKVHPFLILLSILGGLNVFGLIGFLLGPIILSLFFALTDIYIDLIKKPTQS